MIPEPFSLAATRGSDSFPIPLRLRVLVIDDNHDGADSTGDLLAICGAEVHVRYDGETGLAAVQELVPHAVILDLSMPRMDGFEVVRRIRQTTGLDGPLVVALTALGDDRTREQVAASGFNLHFTKPVDPAELLHILGEHMEHVRKRAAQG